MQVSDDSDHPSNDGSNSIASDQHADALSGLANAAHLDRANGTLQRESIISQEKNNRHTNDANIAPSYSDPTSDIHRVPSNESLLELVKNWKDIDVGTFYDIVLAAGRILSSLPEGQQNPTTALFHALDDVLRRTGEKAKYDEKFTPMLLRIGADTQGTILERTKRILDNVGISIEWVPDDLTQNIEIYRGLEPSQINTELPILPGRHVHWRDENRNPAGPSKLHDSYTYDRPSSYTGSNLDNSESIHKDKILDSSEEDEGHSGSFDTYYSEEDRFRQCQPKLLSPESKNGTNGSPIPLLAEDESSSFISSPNRLQPSHVPQCTDCENSNESSTKRCSSPKILSVSSRHGSPRVTQTSRIPKPPAFSPMTRLADTPEPPTNGPLFGKSMIPRLSSQRSPSIQSKSSAANQPREAPISGLPPSSFITMNQEIYRPSSLVQASKSSSPHNSSQLPRKQFSTKIQDTSHEAIQANNHTLGNDENNSDMSEANLTGIIPQIGMFRAHVRKFRHNSLLRQWRDRAVALKGLRDDQRTEARTFSTIRLTDFALFTWRCQATVQWQRRVDMELDAARFDARKLGETTLELWYEKMTEKQRNRAEVKERERNTEFFFDILGSRAEKAYDFCILSRAFTHWEVRAQEERQRTETARRHIMRIRYFDSWKEHTAVNELKVRQFATRHVFAKLQNYLLERCQKSRAATWHHNATIAQHSLQTWRLQARRFYLASKINRDIIHNVMLQWLQQARDFRSQRSQSQSKVGHNARRGLLSAWRDRVALRELQNEEACKLYRKNILYRILEGWTRMAALKQMCTRFRSEKNIGCGRKALIKWKEKTHKEQQAAAINYVKLLRGAIYNWTIKQRMCQFERQNRRSLVENSMYKWYLAERVRFITRIRQTQMMQRAFDGLRSARASTQDRIQNNNRIAENFGSRQLRIQPFRSWYSRLDLQTRREDQAESFRDYRLKHRIFHAINFQAEIRQMRDGQALRLHTWNTWNKLFCQWKQQAEQSYKQKLTHAYRMTKLNTKVGIARGVLVHLKNKALLRAQQKYTASEMRRAKIEYKARHALGAWREQTHQVQSIESRGYNVLQVGALGKWRHQVTVREEKELEAEDFYHEKRLHTAIRAWSLKKLQLRARVHVADELRDRADRSYLRKSLNAWYTTTGKLVQKRGAQAVQTRPLLSNLQHLLPSASLGHGYSSNQYGYGTRSLFSTPAPRGGGMSYNSESASHPPPSAYQASPTSSYDSGSVTDLRHTGSQTQTLALSQGSTVVNESGPREVSTARQQQGSSSVSSLLPSRYRSGGSYFTHRRGDSVPEVRRRSRLSTVRNLGPYSAFDEDESRPIRKTPAPVEEEPESHDESFMDPLVSDIPSGHEANNENTRNSQILRRARPVPENNTSTPIPLRFHSKFVSTTPLAPLPSPFEKQLREQYRSSSDGSITEQLPVATGLPGTASIVETTSPRIIASDVGSRPGELIPSKAKSPITPRTLPIRSSTIPATVTGVTKKTSKFAMPATPRTITKSSKATTITGNTGTPASRLRGLLTVPRTATGPGKKSVNRVRFKGDVTSASDSSTEAVVEGSTGELSAK